jgi:hypothetical protein
MPRPKPCQHHLRHENAVNLPKGYHSVSLKLLKFMRERDNILDLNVRWLCSNCYIFETKELRQNQQMETQWNDSEEEKEEEHTTIDDHTVDAEDSEEDVSSQSDCTTSYSSQESSSSGDDLSVLNYKQEKAWEELKTIFAALDRPPIHDR